MATNLVRYPWQSSLSVKPESGGGLLLLRHVTPLARRHVVHFYSGAYSLLSVFDHCLRSRNYVNVVTCGKQPQLQWLNMDEALEHCSRGASTWKFATNDGGGEPDVVLACAGDVPTIETCAASWLLQKHVPGIKVRVVNVVDLMTLMSPTTSSLIAVRTSTKKSSTQ